jgi:hypothetical protein
MALERRLFAELRSLDQHELRRLLIFIKGLLVAREGPDPPIGDGSHRVAYRLEMVKCGKPQCRSCPHGPYWYAYYREGTRLRSRYIGPELDARVMPGPPPGPQSDV